MILRALNDYYERLAADPDSGVALFGYSRQQISLIVILNQDGTLLEIQDARQADEKGKLRPRSLVVPGNAKPSGSGINPCFLWDNAAYSLGFKSDDPKPERTRQAFEAFRDRHLALESQINDPDYAAVCRFLESWDPARAAEQPALADLATGFVVFQLRNATHFVHERPVVKSWWEAALRLVAEEGNAEVGQCLVTGEVGLIARLHEPKIKGVWGGQSAGGVIVSFNFPSGESYGKSGARAGMNAQTSERAAFQYCTALNSLLDPAAKRRLSIGDTTVVYWTDTPSSAEEWIAELLNPSVVAEDEGQRNRVRSVLDTIVQGKYPKDELGTPTTRFYVLGLAPNAARISIRFWHESTVGDFVEQLHRHYAALEIVRGPNDDPYPAPWRLLDETVRDRKDVPDLLEGALTRTILTGQPYPQMFYAALLRRIQADREVRYVRAAAIKACLIRLYLTEVSVALDPDKPDQAYQLGRLFAQLEKTQEDALPGINDTIKDRYFGGASTTPGVVFPRLIRLNQHHLGKLERGARTYHDRRIQEIAGRVSEFPSHLSLKDQGLFAIGYYHQRLDIFTKKAVQELPAGTSA